MKTDQQIARIAALQIKDQKKSVDDIERIVAEAIAEARLNTPVALPVEYKYSGPLRDADPSCVHVVERRGMGWQCKKCKGWHK